MPIGSRYPRVKSHKGGDTPLVETESVTAHVHVLLVLLGTCVYSRDS